MPTLHNLPLLASVSALIVALTGLSACSSDVTSESQTGGSQDASAADTSAADGATTDGGGADAGSADAAPADTGSADAGAADAGDPGLGPPAPLPYAVGACPKMVSGLNTIKAGGAQRSFRVMLPANPEGAALVFLWHGLGDSAANFINALGGQAIANKYNAVIIAADAVAPVPAAIAIWQFPSPLAQKPPAFDLLLFDALLTCTDEQYDIDNNKVMTAGFSAGAIWSTYLLLERADYLSAALVFSGGIDAKLLFPYKTPTRKVPVMGSHGGPTDQFNSLLFFEPMMTTLSQSLATDGHTMVLCAHSGGHTITGPIVFGGWDFLFAHSWGEAASPYDADQVKAKLPAGCALQ